MVRGCKFVDEVVPGVPYVMNDEYLKWVINEYKIDYVVHGDDPCIVDGKDVYESAQKMGILLFSHSLFLIPHYLSSSFLLHTHILYFRKIFNNSTN